MNVCVEFYKIGDEVSFKTFYLPCRPMIHDIHIFEGIYYTIKYVVFNHDKDYSIKCLVEECVDAIL